MLFDAVLGNNERGIIRQQICEIGHWRSKTYDQGVGIRCLDGVKLVKSDQYTVTALRFRFGDGRCLCVDTEGLALDHVIPIDRAVITHPANVDPVNPVFLPSRFLFLSLIVGDAFAIGWFIGLGDYRKFSIDHCATWEILDAWVTVFSLTLAVP